MISKKTYEKHLVRIEELLKVVDPNGSTSNKLYIELDTISDLVADYEERYYPIPKPSLIDVIQLRMEEMELKQKDLAELLETTTSRISEYLRGKRDITLNMAKKIHTRLDIDADIILQ